ncbi:hypothetical protein SCLARK_001765 [Spiroplasma clarkii]|nr:hypothetical protein SCLARK_001765 [Spiroplasma clarkii]
MAIAGNINQLFNIRISIFEGYFAAIVSIFLTSAVVIFLIIQTAKVLRIIEQNSLMINILAWQKLNKNIWTISKVLPTLVLFTIIYLSTFFAFNGVNLSFSLDVFVVLAITIAITLILTSAIMYLTVAYLIGRNHIEFLEDEVGLCFLLISSLVIECKKVETQNNVQNKIVENEKIQIYIKIVNEQQIMVINWNKQLRQVINKKATLPPIIPYVI